MKDIPNWLIRKVLGHGAGGHMDKPPSETRHLYGGTFLVPAGARSRKAVVAIPVDTIPSPYAIEILFSSDGVNYTRTTPTPIVFEVARALDELTGLTTVTYSLGTGDAFPVCQIIGTTINIVAVGPENAVYLSVVLCPVSSVECPPTVPTPASASYVKPAPWGADQESVTNRYAISEIAATDPEVGEPVRGSEPLRAQFFIQNNSDVDVMVGLTGEATLDPDQPFGVFLLPGGINAIYEGPGGYVGPININVAPGSVDADGYVLVTTGYYA